MNAFQKQILDDPFDGFTEICDVCGAVIFNFSCVAEQARVLLDNKIACRECSKNYDSCDRQNTSE
jgi:hypothetical protein